MINLYINYPNSKFSVHYDPKCSNIHQQHKSDQRNIIIDHSSLSSEVLKFANCEHKFASEKDYNDMWVFIDLDDLDFERAVTDHIWKLLAKHYSPFRGINIEEHCPD